MLPTLFLSHGSPTLLLGDAPAKAFLETLGRELPRPEAILVASAHWQAEAALLSAPARNETIHDFYGFPPALYEFRYDAPPAPGLAARARDCLAAAGFASGIDAGRGLDHGAWVPLLLAYPEADIPVAQVAIDGNAGPERHWRLGQALAPLRAEGVLILGSGSFTHDLTRVRGAAPDAPSPPDVEAFAAWFDAALVAGRSDDLLGYRERAPEAVRQHPTEEHLLPLYVALGAAGQGARVNRLHASATHGVLRMDAYAFA